MGERLAALAGVARGVTGGDGPDRRERDRALEMVQKAGATVAGFSGIVGAGGAALAVGSQVAAAGGLSALGPTLASPAVVGSALAASPAVVGGAVGYAGGMATALSAERLRDDDAVEPDRQEGQGEGHDEADRDRSRGKERDRSAAKEVDSGESADQSRTSGTAAGESDGNLVEDHVAGEPDAGQGPPDGEGSDVGVDEDTSEVSEIERPDTERDADGDERDHRE